MKKKYILFLLFSFVSFYGQTYNFNVNSGILCNTCWEGVQGPAYNSYEATELDLSITNVGGKIISNSQSGFIPNGIKSTSYTKTLAVGSTFVVRILSTGTYTPDNHAFYTCNVNKSSTSKAITDMILDGSAVFFDGLCGIYANITLFKPNLIIKNLDTANPNSVYAGFQLSLNAFSSANDSGIFPNVAYHWQYSLDNKATWIDVPISLNNRPDLSFTIENILGEDHINHFGPIDFRLGYFGRPFSDPYRITYNPGTVVLKDRKYFPPDCNADVVKSIVAYFDRDLIQNEVLSTLQVIPYPKVNGDTPKFSQSEVTALVYDPETQLYKYTFNLSQGDKLENRYYVIEYQSKLNGVTRGTLAVGNPFLYKDPAPLKFEIKKADNPTCAGDLAEISITVSGGTGDYKFYVDGVEKTNPKPVKEVDGFYHIRGLIPTAVNSIKVMDENNCVEKSL